MTEQQRNILRRQLSLVDSVSHTNVSKAIKIHEQYILGTFEHILDKIVIDKDTYQPLLEEFKQCLIYNFNEDGNS